MTDVAPAKPRIAALGALGVVFGDIGTSPLYAMKESFLAHEGRRLDVTPDNVLGILSLIFWTLIIIVSVKYLFVVMRADNDGEGGILALTALVTPRRIRGREKTAGLVLLGLFGAALLYGDGMITPAISVISAVEGTAVQTEALQRFVVPIAAVILIVLFSVQRRGTASISRAFGPVMLLWFVVMGAIGLAHVFDTWRVFEALNPLAGLRFMFREGLTAFLALGSVFLVVTGAEALYADMGQFGRSPIRRGWYAVVLPALLLNYFGQGAMLLEHPDRIDNPFYRMVPEGAVLPLVVLATAAAVIASQALISGAFSLTRQAVQLGYLPRVNIRQTSETARGQIYVPLVNWALLVACLLLVVGFRSSNRLASAYGIAVAMTMVITTLLFYAFGRRKLGWSKARMLAICGAFLVVDCTYLAANLPKIPTGGWFPIIVGGVLFTIFTTWFTGRHFALSRVASRSLPMEELIEDVATGEVHRDPGVVVYPSSNPGVAPHALRTQLHHTHELPETVVVVVVRVADSPHIDRGDRLTYNDLGHGFHRLVYRFGFMDTVDLPDILENEGALLTGIDLSDAQYVVGRETLRLPPRSSEARDRGMALWRERLFVRLVRNASTADVYFKLPPARTIEMGVQVEL